MIFLPSMLNNRSRIPNGHISPLAGPVNRQAGFTILELLVVFTLTALITGIGFVSFSNYSRHQAVDQAAALIKESFQKAKYNAVSQVKLSDEAVCPRLYGYSVTIDTNLNTLTVNQLCVLSGTVTKITAEHEEVIRLSDTVQFDDTPTFGTSVSCPLEVRFGSLNNTITPVTQSLPCSFDIVGNEVTKTLTIERNGSVNIN